MPNGFSVTFVPTFHLQDEQRVLKADVFTPKVTKSRQSTRIKYVLSFCRVMCVDSTLVALRQTTDNRGKNYGYTRRSLVRISFNGIAFFFFFWQTHSHTHTHLYRKTVLPNLAYYSALEHSSALCKALSAFHCDYLQVSHEHFFQELKLQPNL